MELTGLNTMCEQEELLVFSKYFISNNIFNIRLLSIVCPFLTKVQQTTFEILLSFADNSIFSKSSDVDLFESKRGRLFTNKNEIKIALAMNNTSYNYFETIKKADGFFARI